MDPTIYIKPEKTWDFFCWNREKLKVSEAIIAENKDTDYTICITNEEDCPVFIIYKNEDVCVRQKVVSGQNCGYIVEYLYERFLYPVDVVSGIPEPEAKKPDEPEVPEEPDDTPPADFPVYTPDDDEWDSLVNECREFLEIPSKILDDQDPYYEIMYVRQDEVDLAAKDFLRKFLEMEAIPHAMVDDFVWRTMEWAAEEYGISVWYPSEYTDTDTGSDYFVTYPCDSLCNSKETEAAE